MSTNISIPTAEHQNLNTNIRPTRIVSTSPDLADILGNTYFDLDIVSFKCPDPQLLDFQVPRFPIF
ncbi:MAG: hypothetical protein CL913_00330 [Deltaproteobacteria bacterium]|nr:hypothetical protein [Deltaproteobacteria bacterium]